MNVDSRGTTPLRSVIALAALILVSGCQGASQGSGPGQSASPQTAPPSQPYDPSREPDASSADASSSLPPPSLVSEPSSGTPTVQPNGLCPRPSDQGGPLYYELEGIFARIQIDPGGGQWVVLRRSSSTAEEFLPATEDVLARLRSIDIGTRITLVAYRVSSRSGTGASPAFSCLEVHR
jgi:hypothetical protein